MEDALGAVLVDYNKELDQVLILVLMEDALGALLEFINQNDGKMS